jgi:hypothetical protein
MKKIIVIILLIFPLLLQGRIIPLSLQEQNYTCKKDDNTNKYGYVDASGKWVIAPQFDLANAFSENGFARVEKKVGKDYKQGLINKKGEIVVPCSYDVLHDDLYYVSEGIVIVEKDHLQGAYDILNPREQIPCLYDKCDFKWSYIETVGVFIVEKNGKQGMYDIDGKEILPCNYRILDYYSDFYWVMKDGFYKNSDNFGGKWGMMDKRGKLLTPIKYAAIVHFGGRPYGIINEGGIEDEDYNISGGKYGLLHISGKEVVPCKYDDIFYAFEDLFAVNVGGRENAEGKAIGGKWGYVDATTGKEVIPLQYDDVQPFDKGVARVKKDGQLSLLKNPLKEGNVIAAAAQPSKKRDPNAPAVSRYPAPNSDVDKDIPQSKSASENLFAFIIANENYEDVPVPYALNDGRMFREYCLKTLGVPNDHISQYEDASLGVIVAAIERIKKIAEATDGEAEVVIYYAGHGYSDSTQNAYLMPVDGSASDIATTGYSLKKFYGELSKLKLKKISVFLDACYSGAGRDGEMLDDARGIATKVKDETPQGNMLVFSSAAGNQTAHSYEEKGHGLFTYFLLKKLQETGGDVTYGELSEYISKKVKLQSVLVNDKRQTPTVIPSPVLADKWQNIKLK